MKFARVVAVVAAVTTLLSAADAETYSELWGKHGERWSPTSRLPDFSRAGYHSGDADIPDVPVAANARDFGALGDGKTDDTEAIRKAVASVTKGAVLLPTGRYVLTGTITLDRSGVVLRGEGPDRTFLDIPKSLLTLQDEQPLPEGRTRRTHFSFSGSFVSVGARGDEETIGVVTHPAKRGDRAIRCENASSVAPGSFIRIRMEGGAELGRHLHAGQEAGEEQLERGIRVSHVARVESVEGDRIRFDRPLRLDVALAWKPEVRRFDPGPEEIGVEGLTFAFAGTEKRDHLVEEGFNAIYMRGTQNSWVRNVRFEDADMGVKMSGTYFCTVEDVTFTAPKRTTRRTGHHAVWVVRGQDNLVQRFRVETRYVHDLSVEGFANGTVFRGGSGVDVNFDHHRVGPYENLFTNIDAGDGRRLWSSGVSRNRGPHSAARTTIWNVRHQAEEMGEAPDWPMSNIIGVAGYRGERSETGRWIEAPGGVVPVDLYEAQRARRRSSTD